MRTIWPFSDRSGFSYRHRCLICKNVKIFKYIFFKEFCFVKETRIFLGIVWNFLTWSFHDQLIIQYKFVESTHALWYLVNSNISNKSKKPITNKMKIIWNTSPQLTIGINPHGGLEYFGFLCSYQVFNVFIFNSQCSPIMFPNEFSFHCPSSQCVPQDVPNIITFYPPKLCPKLNFHKPM